MKHTVLGWPATKGHAYALRLIAERRNKRHSKPVCRWCNGTVKELVIPIDGKQPYQKNCPYCNRNGRRKPINP